jgi:hypothetical protein
MIKQLMKVVAAFALLAWAGQASAILLEASGGTNDSATISDQTIGNSLTVQYDVLSSGAASGDPWPVFLARLFGPCCNNLFQDSLAPGVTGTESRTVNTSAFNGQIRDLRFDINLFGRTNSFASVRILDVLIDGQSIGVPEPAGLGLLAMGLLGLSLALRRRSAAKA